LRILARIASVYREAPGKGGVARVAVARGLCIVGCLAVCLAALGVLAGAWGRIDK